MKAKGIRDIPTLQLLSKRKLFSTREQAASDIARLEHDKARLERELKLWTTKQAQTEKRLAQVQQQLGMLQQVLNESGDKPKTVKRKRAQLPTGKRKTGDQKTVNTEPRKTWREIEIEY